MSKEKMVEQKYSKGFLWRQRIGFGISDYACNLAYLMVNTYLLIFYTDVARLSAAAVGTMFVVTKFIDAITDYLIGALIDRTNTKMGRNRPWMLLGTPVLAIGMVLVFTVPNFSYNGRLIWAYGTYILFSFGYTLVNIPMGSILPTLSADPVERTNIVTARTIFSNLGSLTSASLALFLVTRLGGGDAAAGYLKTNMIFGVMVIIIMLICVFSIKEINRAPKIVKRTSILNDVKYLIKNKPYMLFLGVTFFLFVGYLGMFAAIAYYFKYIVGNEMLTSVAVSILTIVPIVSMLLSTVMNRKFSKRDITQFGTVIQLIGYALLFFARNSIPMIYLSFTIVGFGMGFRSTMFFSMQADTTDYGEWISGRSLAGTQTAVCGFVNKLASAAASALVAGLLAWGNYDGSLAVQSASANTAINIAFIGIPIVCCIACLVIMVFYNLDKIYPQIKRDIDERRNMQKSAV